MKVQLKMTGIITLIILENMAVLFVGAMYLQYQEYQKTLIANQGLIEKCEDLSYSDDFFTILEKMNEYLPTVLVRTHYIHLNYGNEIPSGSGVGLLFDNTYKLVDKFCSNEWEKGTKDILTVD